MASVVDTVNMSSEQRTSYRHGDLSAALVRAGIELAQSGGPQAVVLREATRRVGVSPNAAYRHFADHRALLRAVAAVAMSQLAETMERRQSAVSTRIRPPRRARERLRAVGAGYLDYARAEPGLFRTAFTVADELDDALAVGPSGRTPFQLLSDALDGLVEVGLLSPRRRPDAELLAWSSVHGLAMLLIEGPLQQLDEAHTRQVCDQLLDHIEAGLLSQPA
jgi:AcrR family transcriptional regulator